VLELRYRDGREIDQIAEQLGLTRNAIDQALHRGHAKLRESHGG
jgi:DNA-directed RNA polymerase specialized sigma24 family protein